MKQMFTLFALVPVLMMGCRAIPPYTVAIQNTGTVTVYEAHVCYNGFVSAGGALTPGASKFHLLPDVPVPQIAEVEWQTADGRQYSQKVDVKAALHGQPAVEKVLLFRIDSANHVDVSLKTGL